MSRRAGWLVIGLATVLMVSPALGMGSRSERPNALRNLHAVSKSPSALQRQKSSPKEIEVKRTKVPMISTGPLHIVVSIASQRLTVFNNGVAIAHSPVSTGTASHPTPMGIFAIIGKNKWHRSNIYSGAPMPYMQRITWSGVALHAGALPGYPASHGCIRLPEAFAIRLWGMTRLGARVIVTRDPVAPVEIAHSRLFAPQEPIANPPAAELRGSVAIANLTAAPIGEDTKIAEAGKPQVIMAAAELPVEAKPKVSAENIPTGEPAKRKGPVQVFVSRKDAKVYVRQDFAPLFDAPVTIAEPQKPWGTHVFTVMEIKDAAVRWTAITVPSSFGRKAERDRRALSPAEAARQSKAFADLARTPSAEQALERFDLSRDVISRISELLAPGSALIVSDNPLSDETGLGTDFVVLTRYSSDDTARQTPQEARTRLISPTTKKRTASRS